MVWSPNPHNLGHDRQVVAAHVPGIEVRGEAPAIEIRKGALVMNQTAAEEMSPRGKKAPSDQFDFFENIELLEKFLNPVLVLFMCLGIGGGFRKRSLQTASVCLCDIPYSRLVSRRAARVLA